MNRLIIYLIVFTVVCSIPSKGQSIEDRTNITYGEKTAITELNTEKYIEFAPSISADGKTMIFESDRMKGWKLFESQLDDTGKWTEPKPVDKINNFGRTKDLIGGPSISYDGNYLYFFGFFLLQSDSEDIFVSKREKEGWSEPIKLSEPVNTHGYEGFPAISPDDKTLYFIRVNENSPIDDNTGDPCFTIYRSHLNTDGTWEEPEPMPAPINMACERSPRILADGRTLIFSSNRPGGKGGYDLYQTHINSDGTWAEPINLDFVNTEEDDLSPCISASGDEMYFYSQNDIYKVNIPPRYRQYNNITVNGFVTDHESGIPVHIDIHVKNAENGEVISSVENSATDGRFSVVLTAGLKYEMEFNNEKYISQSYPFDLSDLETYREEHLIVSLKNSQAVKFKVLDKELNIPVQSDVQIKESNGDESFERKGVDNFEYEFKVNGEYTVSVLSEKYTSFEQKISSTEISGDQTIFLDHTKVGIIVNTTDINNNDKVKTRLKFTNKDNSEVIEDYSNELVQLRNGDRYEIASRSKGYFFATTEFDSDDLDPDQIVDGVYSARFELPLEPIKVGAHLELKGIYFDSNSSELQDQSIDELKRVIHLMEDNPEIVIEIAAHTDNVGSSEYNLKLSEDRAKSVVNYLQLQGVDKDKTIARGYGESKPVVPNNSEENKAKNRRVNLMILEVE